jgi:hypothetical protein
MPNKLKAKWKAGVKYLPPFTIKESVDTLLHADKIFAEGTMTYDEATKLVIRFRETNGEMYTNMVRDEIDRQIIEDIKNTIGEPLKGT